MLSVKTIYFGGGNPPPPPPPPSFSPSSLSPILWLDAQTAGTLTISDTDKVDGWASRAAGGSAAETGTKRPAFSSSALGAGDAKPGVVFAGGDDRLVLESFTALGGATAFTIAMVMKSTGFEPNNAVFATRDFGPVGVQVQDLNAAGIPQMFRVGDVERTGTSPGIQTNTAPHMWSEDGSTVVTVLSFRASSAPGVADGLIAAWRNGTQIESRSVISGAVQNGAGENIYSLGNYNGGNNGKNMTMGEFIIIDRVLTTNERTSLETYLSTRWA